MVQPVRPLFEDFVRTDAKDLPAPGAGEMWRRFVDWDGTYLGSRDCIYLTENSGSKESNWTMLSRQWSNPATCASRPDNMTVTRIMTRAVHRPSQ